MQLFKVNCSCSSQPFFTRDQHRRHSRGNNDNRKYLFTILTRPQMQSRYALQRISSEANEVSPETSWTLNGFSSRNGLDEFAIELGNLSFFIHQLKRRNKELRSITHSFSRLSTLHHKKQQCMDITRRIHNNLYY